MKSLVWFIILLPIYVFGQYDPKIESYQHHNIFTKGDTIRYHVYANGPLIEKSKLLIFFHGSGPGPLFERQIKFDTIPGYDQETGKPKIRKSIYLNTSVPFDLEQVPDDYALVLISKKGVPFLTETGTYQPGKLFYRNESLDYRVWQGNLVINDLIKKWIKRPTKVVILGHSEGSDIVAKLGYVNKKVTHIGYFAGGANTQYYDFALMIQKRVLKGEVTQEEAIKELDSLFLEINSIQKEPNSTEKWWLGHTYRRWSRFTEPSLANLLKIKKPIYVAVAAKDESVPFESSLLIPIEFNRLNRKNLTFKMYPHYNHTFATPPTTENGEWSWEFMKVFEDFIKWVD